MNNPTPIILAAGCGAVIGAIFFGGLHWTIRHGLHSNTPALWFLGSLLLRTGTAIAGFFLIASGDWHRLIAGLLGFLCIRVLIQWLSRVPRQATP
jgi:F1F0 ATPase subunit 2